jgi:hypothetical protein
MGEHVRCASSQGWGWREREREKEKEEEDGQWWSTGWTSKKKKERNWKLGMAGKHAFKLSLRWRP